MNNEIMYLSDEELDLLIADVEAGDCVAAPPDMLDEIMMKLEADENKHEESIQANPSKENIDDIVRPPRNIVPIKKGTYIRYCIRVIGSVAAAIVLLLVVPEVTNTQNMSQLSEKMTQYSLANITSNTSLTESIKINKQQTEIPSKEDVLKDSLFGLDYRMPSIVDSKAFNFMNKSED